MSLGEKNYKPTRKRLQKAANQGQFLNCPEISHSFGMLAGICSILFVLKSSWVRFEGMVNYSLVEGYKFPVQLASCWLEEILHLGGIVCFSFGSIAILAQLIQRGFVLRFGLLSCKLSRLSPINGMGKIISGLRSIFWSGFKLFICVAILLVGNGYIFMCAYKTLISNDLTAPDLMSGDLIRPIGIFFSLSSMALLLTGAMEFLLRRREYRSQLWMNREELLKEQKDEEGDPLFRAHRKAMHRAFVMQELISRVRRSRVILFSGRGTQA